jgi:hypothetical protein
MGRLNYQAQIQAVSDHLQLLLNVQGGHDIAEPECLK